MCDNLVKADPGCVCNPLFVLVFRVFYQFVGKLMKCVWCDKCSVTEKAVTEVPVASKATPGSFTMRKSAAHMQLQVFCVNFLIRNSKHSELISSEICNTPQLSGTLPEREATKKKESMDMDGYWAPEPLGAHPQLGRIGNRALQGARFKSSGSTTSTQSSAGTRSSQSSMAGRLGG